MKFDLLFVPNAATALAPGVGRLVVTALIVLQLLLAETFGFSARQLEDARLVLKRYC